MKIVEHVSLTSLTTFKVGGDARYVLACESVEDIQGALAFIRERSLSWYVLGGGSNVLASDSGYEGVILQLKNTEVTFSSTDTARESCVVVVGAGVSWDALVSKTVAEGLWGLENLAGIPGSVGAAPVQNIGAYGADVSDTLLYVDAFDTKTDALVRLTKDECVFGYRNSLFKEDPAYIIVRVAFQLSKIPTPRIQYADLLALREQGRVLDTSLQIAEAVREVRSKKFPDLHITGTAGSFFKNPTISSEAFSLLKAQYPELPGFPSSEDASVIKIPLGWILDHVLNLRGYTKGQVRLFEKQALVLVAEHGATTEEINAFAKEVETKVFSATGIKIEREVRML